MPAVKPGALPGALGDLLIPGDTWKELASNRHKGVRGICTGLRLGPLGGSHIAAPPTSAHVPERRLSGDLGHLCLPCGCARFGLTDREREVLAQLAEGKSSHEAAQTLYVSDQAITYHVGNLLAKFQCTNRTALIARAFVLGVLSLTWPPRVIDRPHDAGTGATPPVCQSGVKELNRRRTFVWS